MATEDDADDSGKIDLDALSREQLRKLCENVLELDIKRRENSNAMLALLDQQFAMMTELHTRMRVAVTKWVENENGLTAQSKMFFADIAGDRPAGTLQN